MHGPKEAKTSRLSPTSPTSMLGPPFPSRPTRKGSLGKSFLSFIVVYTAFTTMGIGCRSKSEPQLAALPLSAEQIQVYRNFLEAFSSLRFRRLANQTAPFLQADLPEGSPCVQGIDLEDQSSARKELHRFGPEITNQEDIILVDPVEQARLLEEKESELTIPSNATKEDKLKITEKLAFEYGFLGLSEIVFDKKHQFAVLKYVYFCGTHCKHGGTLVLEKVGSSWSAKTRRPCTLLIN